MKLVASLLAILLAVPGVAAANGRPRHPHGPPSAAGAPARPLRHAPLKRALLARFDRDHDGRLDRRERRQAIRALRRLERQLARPPARGSARGAMIRRYDRDGDGNVGPREMPPRAARQLRPLDRDHDGWVSPGEE